MTTPIALPCPAFRTERRRSQGLGVTASQERHINQGGEGQAFAFPATEQESEKERGREPGLLVKAKKRHLAGARPCGKRTEALKHLSMDKNLRACHNATCFWGCKIHDTGKVVRQGPR